MEAQRAGRLFVVSAVSLFLAILSVRAAEQQPAPPAQPPQAQAQPAEAPAGPAAKAPEAKKPEAPAQPASAPPAAKVPEVEAPVAPAQPAAAPLPKPEQPAAAPDPEQGRDVVLTGLTDTDCGDIYGLVAQFAMVRLNYAKSDRDLPERAAGMTRHAVFTRKDADGSTRTLLVGLTCYASQDPHLYLWGTLTAADGVVSADPDLDALVGTAEDAVKAGKAAPRKYSVRDLLYQTYQLSNIDVQSCIDMLKSLGYNTAPPGENVDLTKLPAIFPIPFKSSSTVVGLTLDEKKAVLNDPTLSGPENRLMILYHVSQTQQVADLEDLLNKTIDVPADQVLIEGMVIELTEEELKELGIEWQTFGRDYQLSFLSDEDLAPFIIKHDPAFAVPAGLANKIKATLTAIINEGKAQVLSSPSVLVLDNRNAKIQVTQDVPIFNTVLTYNTTSFNVRFETAGITLNVRPRISQDGESVSLQILAEVSEAPKADFITLNGQEVAPVINRRIVETVARVNNNTPFIIGGLIRNEKSQTVNRVPILSAIPILGQLFRQTSDSGARREVIIVLTPRVIKVGGSNRPVLPKDSESFDFLNNQLFRNSYRLKAEDIFDVGFLENNTTVLETMDQARALVHRRPELANKPPYKDLISGVIPGEDAVVIRMIFEICRNRLQLYNAIPDDHIILFVKDPTDPAGFKVEFLSRNGKGILEKASPDGTLAGYFKRPYPKKVLFIRYTSNPDGGMESALQSPAASLEWLTVNNNQEVQQHLQDIDVLSPDHQYHEFAIALDSASDLVRLKSCMAERELTSVNNVQDLLTLRNFRIGRKIVVPELAGEASRMFLIDRTAAEYFFKSDYYYYALRQQLEQAYKTINDAVSQEPGL
jgi:Flp pilus assembly secretin CpaC